MLNPISRNPTQSNSFAQYEKAEHVLLIDLAENSISWQTGIEPIGNLDESKVKIKFKRRWECHLLSQLLSCAEKNLNNGWLSVEIFNQYLHELHQSKALARVQLIRLLDSLESGLTVLDPPVGRIEYLARKRSVGPWRLLTDKALHWKIIDASFLSEKGGIQPNKINPQQISTQRQTPEPKVCAKPMQTKTLREILHTILVADCLLEAGHVQASIEHLDRLLQLELSEDMRTSFRLRKLESLRRLGEFDKCKQELLALQAEFQSGLALRLQDQALINETIVLQMRIDYDSNPGHAYLDLLPIANLPKMAVTYVDPRILANWHNLRALVLRRAQSNGQGKNGHGLALQHLESAIYLAAQVRDWNKLQAYICNYAFHLQTAMSELKISVAEVLSWHQLINAFADKLGTGNESCWERIFFMEFWLDNENQIAQYVREHGSENLHLAMSVGDYMPNHFAFYDDAYQRSLLCGDLRQRAIVLIHSARFAKKSPNLVRFQAYQKELIKLLSTNPDLIQILEKDGYCQYLPSL